jgi:LacI family transcriptional regulator
VTARYVHLSLCSDEYRHGSVTGNIGIADAFDAAGRACEVFIGHDLAKANRELLEAGRQIAVLHHVLGADMRRVARLSMTF